MANLGSMISSCIIVPVYKVTLFLQECLDSIRNQSNKDFQSILTDDGSPDNDAAMCDKCVMEDVRFVCIHQSNGGLSIARNHALDLNTKSFVTFVDSDDTVTPTYLEILLANFTDDVDIVQCCTEYMKLNKDIPITRTASRHWANKLDKITACKSLFHSEGQYIVTAWAKLYRNELWKRQRFPEKKLFEDSRVMHCIFWKMRNMLWLSTPLYHYRFRSDSIMRNPQLYENSTNKTVAEERLAFFATIGHNELHLLALKSRINELLEIARNSRKKERNLLFKVSILLTNNITSFVTFSLLYKLCRYYLIRIWSKLEKFRNWC